MGFKICDSSKWSKNMGNTFFLNWSVLEWKTTKFEQKFKSNKIEKKRTTFCRVQFSRCCTFNSYYLLFLFNVMFLIQRSGVARMGKFWYRTVLNRLPWKECWLTTFSIYFENFFFGLILFSKMNPSMLTQHYGTNEMYCLFSGICFDCPFFVWCQHRFL